MRPVPIPAQRQALGTESAGFARRLSVRGNQWWQWRIVGNGGIMPAHIGRNDEPIKSNAFEWKTRAQSCCVEAIILRIRAPWVRFWRPEPLIGSIRAPFSIMSRAPGRPHPDSLR
jgi:hypothetical protein